MESCSREEWRQNARKSFIIVEGVNPSEGILREPEEIFKAENHISSLGEGEGRRYISSKMRYGIL